VPSGRRRPLSFPALSGPSSRSSWCACIRIQVGLCRPRLRPPRACRTCLKSWAQVIIRIVACWQSGSFGSKTQDWVETSFGVGAALLRVLPARSGPGSCVRFVSAAFLSACFILVHPGHPQNQGLLIRLRALYFNCEPRAGGYNILPSNH